MTTDNNDQLATSDACVAASVVNAAPSELAEIIRALAMPFMDNGKKAYEAATEAHQQIKHLVALNPLLTDCRVFVFGSILSMGSWSGHGDLDLALLVPSRWDNGTWPPQKVDVTMAKILEAFALVKVKDIIPLYSARIPIVKHTVDPSRRLYLASAKPFGDAKYMATVAEADGEERIHSFERWQDAFEFIGNIPSDRQWNWLGPDHSLEMLGIDFDLSLRGSGLGVSWLLRRYMEQSSLARVGIVFLKHWGKSVGLNNPNQGYFNSFATTLLWLYFLIQRRRISFVDPTPFRTQPTSDYADVAPYVPLVECDFPPDFFQSVSGSVTDFFRYYAREFDWESNVVSICQERCISKKELGWVMDNEKRTGSPVYYRICLQEPLEQEVNIARRLDGRKKGAASVRPFFERAIAALDSGNCEALMSPN